MASVTGLTALKNTEDGIVESLKNADLECLSEDALEIGVIPQDAGEGCCGIHGLGSCATPQSDQVPTDACIQGNRGQP